MISREERLTAGELERLARPLNAEHMKSAYQQLETVVSNGLKAAHQNNKKLLIIAGEHHDNYGSLVLQTLLLYIVKHHNITHLVAEDSPELLHRTLHRPRVDENKAMFEYSQPLAYHELKMNIIPADYDLGTLSIEERDAMYDKREEFMISKCLEMNQHALFVVGGAHLITLMNSEALQKQYHVVGLNIACFEVQKFINPRFKPHAFDEKTQKAIHFLTKSETVIQMKLDGNPIYLTPERIISIARDVHQGQMARQHVVTRTSQTPADASSDGLKIFTNHPTHSASITPSHTKGVRTMHTATHPTIFGHQSATSVYQTTFSKVRTLSNSPLFWQTKSTSHAEKLLAETAKLINKWMMRK